MFGQLLEFDVLFVSESAQIVLQLHTIPVVATNTHSGLTYPRVLQLNLHHVPALRTAEAPSLHLGMDIRHAYHDTSDCHQSTYLIGIQFLDEQQVGCGEILES